jgi:hypothetical protein
MTTYYDLTASTHLTGAPVEGFRENLDFTKDETPAIMTATLSPTNNLKRASDAINVPDTNVSNPYGYGYEPTLLETRVQDVNEILAQESTNFALGAVAGVSLIVFGILMASVSNASSPP